MDLILTAILLGVLEGLAEFLPVSSTGHLILAQALFGYDPKEWAQFNVVIQLGAIAAVIVTYRKLFWFTAVGLLRGKGESVRFVRNVALGFMPAAVIGLMAKDAIDAMLGSPMVVAVALVIGGVAMLVLERRVAPREDNGVAELPMRTALLIGLAQCLAMIPGTSRSGATILGGLALGVGRRTAAEFSFFLAVPTMLGAATVKILDDPSVFAGGTTIGLAEIAAGFVSSFVVAMIIIRAFVAYVSKRGFAPFAWYRIVVGLAAVAWLTLR
ncbi:undecaprenyl-diphosphate phosphatase [Altererythrobacter sp. TH136]|uniref:undecaprenyl-diphosphate phosphatase n=1 Tax=Altererythrobacter sp. TH136 TaxID=2067415 RepID=UPI001162AB05|nr:undecaprenyl-diphosphate phosphatase [Altererythrobacter sp. TH136]QDM40941.1 undecaprenyl-diphosphate phosphatase [Altererythrobacter sp. TH136]